MIKRFCDVCGKEIIKPVYYGMVFGENTTAIECRDRYELCPDCEQAIKACIGNRTANAERGNK